MNDMTSILNLKREQFHVHIRKQRNEKQFKEQRKHYFLSLFLQQKQMQEISAKIRDIMESGEQLCGEMLIMIVEKIEDVLERESNLKLLDTIDAAIWMLKSVDAQIYEDELSDNYKMHRIIDKMIPLSQGYSIHPTHMNQQIIIYAAKFLKYWTLMDDKLIYNYYGEVAETVYFLLNKQEMIFIKRGVEIMLNLFECDDGRLLSKLHEVLICGQNLVKPICILLQNNLNSDIQTTLFKIVLQTFLMQDRNGMNQYLNYSNQENKQQFFDILIELVQESEENSRKLFRYQLHLIHLILEYSQNERELLYEYYKQKMNSSEFRIKMKDQWLFHEWNSIQNIVHQIQIHLEE
ncbi:unnamed protein product [Paramecium primaurelia]|uniref:Uncharacterized protein n=2 Tax=Paramecium primaurelia TaxID=5886 RepID=A0A8S1MCL6_PARPR|nr:unnamed protein product [Paramecium primaurelia]